MVAAMQCYEGCIPGSYVTDLASSSVVGQGKVPFYFAVVVVAVILVVVVVVVTSSLP